MEIAREAGVQDLSFELSSFGFRVRAHEDKGISTLRQLETVKTWNFETGILILNTKLKLKHYVKRTRRKEGNQETALENFERKAG